MQSDPVTPIVLDQDPTAIPLVYGQLLVEDGRLSPEAFERHLTDLVRLEIDRAGRLANRRVVLLDASPEVPAARCVGKFAAPASPAFLARVRVRFWEVFRDLPGTVVVDCSGQLDGVLKEVSRFATELLPEVSQPNAA